MKDTLKTLSISLCSSLCTALLVVACTAGADKMSDDDDWDNDGTPESAPPDVGFGGDDDDGLSSEELAELTATVAAQQEAIVALEEFQASSLCFIGHMTDDEHWRASSSDEGHWRELEGLDHSGQENWRQGPNGDAIRAYEDCF